MIVPSRNPSKVLRQKLQIGICAVLVRWPGKLVFLEESYCEVTNLSMASSIVVQREDLSRRLAGPASIGSILIDIISQMDNIVVLILSGSVAISVKVAVD